ncbi:hypothetical protein [Mycolicibacterium flavescens]|uniref:Integral membrane protein n=1 Tax=Mycolicibacterium flavescens TaxID=1776 RepID=A0A1E3RMU2_MYCFV|nr:hypothetical protein [Mycolicibacterium flavescens]ODQ91215.1 hypothetical protein BHQ18_07465 [Mycolicibacterium flavescens]
MERRVPIAAGVTFAVLYGVALATVPPLPRIGESGLAVVAHINDNATAMRTQALLVAFAALALVVVLSHVRSRLAGAYAYMFTIGSALVLTKITVATWFTAGLALHPSELGSATARTLADVVSMSMPILTVANIMVAAPVLLAANEGRFPRWVGIAAAVFTVEQLIETITIIGPPGSFISPGGPMNIYLGGPLFVAFFLALGVALSLPEDGGEDTDADTLDAPTDAPDETGTGPDAPADESSER